ncbi:hypothetical protein CDAR_467571 [Caerostris darwini]|uniref:Uncharacterized protein n=1 Tax=Caerostris darwini TaxID=1538125 RepID=A0AAV4RQH3_9ARAC|nr:hypothetical protein CDAR_467571 [Caerostris darwini]
MKSTQAIWFEHLKAVSFPFFKKFETKRPVLRQTQPKQNEQELSNCGAQKGIIQFLLCTGHENYSPNEKITKLKLSRSQMPPTHCPYSVQTVVSIVGNKTFFFPRFFQDCLKRVFLTKSEDLECGGFWVLIWRESIIVP